MLHKVIILPEGVINETALEGNERYTLNMQGAVRTKVLFTFFLFNRLKSGRTHLLRHHILVRDDACLARCRVFHFIWRSDVRSCHQSCAIFDQVPTFPDITC